MEGHRKGREKKKKAEVYTEAEERMENIEEGKIKKKVEKKRAGFISTRLQLKAALISSPIDLVPYLHSFSAPGHEKKKKRRRKVIVNTQEEPIIGVLNDSLTLSLSRLACHHQQKEERRNKVGGEEERREGCEG